MQVNSHNHEPNAKDQNVRSCFSLKDFPLEETESNAERDIRERECISENRKTKAERRTGLRSKGMSDLVGQSKRQSGKKDEYKNNCKG